MEKGYKKLLAWKKADKLAYQIYLETRRFPKEELFGIASQLRRAAISVPTNLAESSGRQNRNELKQFLIIARGSLYETVTLIKLCLSLNYIENSLYEDLITDCGVIQSKL